MGAKFKSKTRLLSTFFLFLALFFARLASKFEKSTNMANKKICLHQKKYQKTLNVMLISNPLNKFLKNAQKKL